MGTSVALIAVLVVATACGGETIEPGGLDDGTKKETSAEPTPESPPEKESPTPEAEPTDPAETEVGKFIIQYVDAINQARANGDTSAMLELGTSDCEPCTYMAEYLSGIYDKGGEYTGGDPAWKVSEFATMPEGTDPVVIDVYIELPKVDLIESSGEDPVPQEAGVQLNRFEVTKDGGSWKVEKFYLPDVSQG